jgi:serine/threonine protein kinase
MKSLNENIMRHLRRVIELPDLSETKYRINERIASGGMGTVYLAEDADLCRKVALKVTNSSPGITKRTQQEAQFIAQLEHPGIVPIHDMGMLPDGRIYYVMKLVEGKRLDEIVGGGAPQRELLKLFQKICEPVAFAHSRGVIHRDLKPENIMIGNFGEVLVMDWGAAKCIRQGTNSDELSVNFINQEMQGNSTSPNGTLAGTVIGTPGYMSPEQKDGRVEDQDAKSDIYGLGAILYYMITGQHPAHGGIGHDTVLSQANGLPGLCFGNKKISKQLNAICVKAMSPAPTKRYPDVSTLAADINKFLDGSPVTAYRENVLEKLSRWFTRNQVLVWLIVAYLIMRAIVLIYFGR